MMKKAEVFVDHVHVVVEEKAMAVFAFDVFFRDSNDFFVVSEA